MPKPSEENLDISYNVKKKDLSRSNYKETNDLVHNSPPGRRDLLKKLPEGALLSTPFTPVRTPVRSTIDPKLKRKSSQSGQKVSQKINGQKEKKSQWYSRSKSTKSLKTDDDIIRRCSFVPKSLIERRWSAVSHVAAFKKHKKRNSLVPAVSEPEISELSASPPTDEADAVKTNSEPDYVRISRSEYEEIKHKVSEIERRISLELDFVQSEMNLNHEENTDVQFTSSVKSVQTAYEQTLVQAKPLSPTTDHLARRLSKELKIRRHSENKIIRSPSARKIGTMRRRSRELEKQNMKLKRHQSWHSTAQVIPRVSLKRGKPNTVLSGLPTPSKCSNNNQFTCSTPLDFPIAQSIIDNKTKPDLTKSQSFSSSHNYDSTSCSLTRWTSAEGFFENKQTPNFSDSSNVDNSRPSLVRLRHQNAGMVLAKAKLFDNLIDSDSSLSFKSDETHKTDKPDKVINKIGNVKHTNTKISCRVRVLKGEEQNFYRKSQSPLRRNVSNNRQHQMRQFQRNNENMLSEKNRLNNIRSTQQRKDCNKIIVPDVPSLNSYSTPIQRTGSNNKKTTPGKSPKRSFKASHAEKRTPLRVLGNTP